MIKEVTDSGTKRPEKVPSISNLKDMVKEVTEIDLKEKVHAIENLKDMVKEVTDSDTKRPDKALSISNLKEMVKEVTDIGKPPTGKEIIDRGRPLTNEKSKLASVNSKDVEIRDRSSSLSGKRDSSRRRLSQSSMEMTTVINNITTVTGIAYRNDDEKFSMSINFPSSTPVDDDLSSNDETKITDLSEAPQQKIIPKNFDKNYLNDSDYSISNNEKKIKKKPNIVECEIDDVKGIEPDVIIKSEIINKTDHLIKPEILNIETVYNHTEEKHTAKFGSLHDLLKENLNLEINLQNAIIDEKKVKKSEINQQTSSEALNNNIEKEKNIEKSPSEKSVNTKLNQENNERSKLENKPIALSNSIKNRLNFGGFQSNNEKPNTKSQLKLPKNLNNSKRSLSTSRTLLLDAFEFKQPNSDLDSNYRNQSAESRFDLKKKSSDFIDIDFDEYNKNVIEKKIEEIEVEEVVPRSLLNTSQSLQSLNSNSSYNFKSGLLKKKNKKGTFLKFYSIFIMAKMFVSIQTLAKVLEIMIL